RLTEDEVRWLRGYEDAAPVRIGNAAADQLQLDVYGEVLDALYQARRMGLAPSEAAWNLERELVEHLERIWDLPDEGLWEVRGGRRQFTHSKVMAWVAFDGSLGRGIWVAGSSRALARLAGAHPCRCVPKRLRLRA